VPYEATNVHYSHDDLQIITEDNWLKMVRMIGARVEIHGLTSRKDLNGRLGRVFGAEIRRDPKGVSRWPVRLDGEDYSQAVHVKESNLAEVFEVCCIILRSIVTCTWEVRIYVKTCASRCCVGALP